MQYSHGDLDALENFFARIDFGAGIEFRHNHALMEINRDYVDERIRLMRLNLDGAKNEKYGLAWFEVLVALKEKFASLS